MKNLTMMIAMFLALGASAQVEKPFTVKGKLTNISNPVEKLFYHYRKADKVVQDSIVPVNGMYAFSGSIAEPVIASLWVKYKVATAARREVAIVFVQPGTVEVNSIDSFLNMKVKGSKAHDEYLAFTQFQKPVKDQMKAATAAYNQAYKDKNEAEKSKWDATLDSLYDEDRKMNGVYFKKNTHTPIASYLLNNFAGYDIKVNELEPLFNQLSKDQKSFPSFVSLSNKMETARKTGIGVMAPEFVQNDTLGKPVALKSFRGKYLLIDFWASWCGPCRAENPNVVVAFNTYKDKGFHILGVSLDQENGKEKWMEAIHKDGLTWTQVSDLQSWNNAVAKQYGVQAIPQNFLLDPTGKIIAKNLRGKELQTKLAEIFK